MANDENSGEISTDDEKSDLVERYDCLSKQLANLSLRFSTFEDKLDSSMASLNKRIVDSIDSWVNQSTRSVKAITALNDQTSNVMISLDQLVSLQAILKQVVDSISELKVIVNYERESGVGVSNLAECIKASNIANTLVAGISACASVINARNSKQESIEI